MQHDVPIAEVAVAEITLCMLDYIPIFVNTTDKTKVKTDHGFSCDPFFRE